MYCDDENRFVAIVDEGLDDDVCCVVVGTNIETRFALIGLRSGDIFIACDVVAVSSIVSNCIFCATCVMIRCAPLFIFVAEPGAPGVFTTRREGPAEPLNNLRGVRLGVAGIDLIGV